MNEKVIRTECAHGSRYIMQPTEKKSMQKRGKNMPLEKALQILEIVKCDVLGYARDLSYTPDRKDIGQALETVLEILITKNSPASV